MRSPPVLAVSKAFRRVTEGLLTLVSRMLTCPNFIRAFDPTLTTTPFERSSLDWFGTCSRKPIPRGPPSSFAQLIPTVSCSLQTPLPCAPAAHTALRSSAVGSQHCKSLQLRIWEAQLWFQ